MGYVLRWGRVRARGRVLPPHRRLARRRRVWRRHSVCGSRRARTPCATSPHTAAHDHAASDVACSRTRRVFSHCASLTPTPVPRALTDCECPNCIGFRSSVRCANISGGSRRIMRGACACAVVCALVALCAGAGGAGEAGGAAGGLDPAARAAAEQQLLALLGLPRRPAPRAPAAGPPPVPRALRLLYERDGALPTAAANTVRAFHHEPSPLDDRFPDEHRFRLYFNLSASVPGDETARGAHLTLQSAARGTGAGAQRLLLYDVVRPGRRGRSAPLLRLIDSVQLAAGAGAVTADALPAARRWLAEPRHNHGLLVRVVEGGSGAGSPRPHVRVRRRAADEDAAWAAARPLLLLYTEDARAREARATRSKRGAGRRSGHRGHARRKEAREMCQRRPLFVDFADVGWKDWIVAPPGYDAYYCQGDCPYPITDHLNGTNHAIVQTLVNSVNPATVPKACCVPTELSSISMLYMDEQNNVVLKNYQDMMVVGCGCR